MATFTYVPDQPATESTQLYLRQFTAADYQQRGDAGLNPCRDIWSLTFSARSAVDTSSILNFLDARNGKEPFEWETPFGETGQFIATKWNASIDSCYLRTISADFELTYLPDKTNPPTPAIVSSTFTWIPDFVAQYETDTNIKKVAFGDGYTQNVVYGINNQKQRWNLNFRNRTNTERDEIRQFLRALRGETLLTWVDPLTAATNKYTCPQWSITFNNHNNNDIQLSFERRFES